MAFFQVWGGGREGGREGGGRLQEAFESRSQEFYLYMGRWLFSLGRGGAVGGGRGRDKIMALGGYRGEWEGGGAGGGYSFSCMAVVVWS